MPAIEAPGEGGAALVGDTVGFLDTAMDGETDRKLDGAVVGALVLGLLGFADDFLVGVAEGLELLGTFVGDGVVLELVVHPQLVDGT